MSLPRVHEMLIPDEGLIFVWYIILNKNEDMIK